MVAKAKNKKVNLGRIRKLSKLLETALDDIQKFVSRKHCVVSMNSGWLWSQCKRPTKKHPCHACFAGAVMYMSLGADDPVHGYAPADFSTAVRDRLYALDQLRSGCVEQAAHRLGYESLVPNRTVRDLSHYNSHGESVLDEKDTESWRSDQKEWRDWLEDMLKMLADLKAAGE